MHKNILSVYCIFVVILIFVCRVWYMCLCCFFFFYIYFLCMYIYLYIFFVAPVSIQFDCGSIVIIVRIVVVAFSVSLP